MVYPDIICEKSKFFRAACSERWSEGQNKIVRLPEQEPSTFQSYLDWVYSGQVTVDKKSIHSTLFDLIDLYLLGDFLDDVKLRNKCTKALTAYSAKHPMNPGPECITRLWSHTSAGCPLRKWSIDNTVMRLDREYLAQHIANYPAELVQQIAVAAAQKVETESSRAFGGKLPEYLEPEEESA